MPAPGPGCRGPLRAADLPPPVERGRTAPMRAPHEFLAIDPAVRQEVVDLPTAPVTGILYRPAGREPEVAVLAMHPRGNFSRHYLAPPLVAGGYAFFGCPTRYLNNDADALHER